MHPVECPCMPNSPSLNRTNLVVRIERGLKRQVQKAAGEQRITPTALVNRILAEELADVDLTPEDYRLIADEIEAELKKRRHSL
jgi:hypothetical protein